MQIELRHVGLVFAYVVYVFFPPVVVVAEGRRQEVAEFSGR